MMKKLLLAIMIFTMVLASGCKDNNDTDVDQPDDVIVDDNTTNDDDTEADDTEDDSDLNEDENQDTDTEQDENQGMDDVFNDETGEDAEEEELEGVFSHIYTFEIMDRTMYARTEVNIRTKPSTEGDILGQFHVNDEVHVIGRCIENGWYMVEYNGEQAFVHDDYLVDAKITTADLQYEWLAEMV